MKKIAFVIESLHHGGAEKSLVTLLNLLNYNDLQIDLILFKKGGEFEKFIPKHVNVIYESSFKKTNRLNLLISRFKFWYLKTYSNKKKYHHAQIYWKVFGKLILKLKTPYDIAIAYNQGFATYYVSEKIISPKKYAWLNTDYQKAGYTAVFDYKMYATYKKIVCVSKENEWSFIEANHLIGKSLPTCVIKDITDPVMVKKMSLEETDLRMDTKDLKILTVGRLAKPKAIELAIESCYLLKDKGIKLKWYVIGEGSERMRLERKINQHNLSDTFILLGYKENPYPYIKNCDIYVQTSLFEGLGLTVIEAALLQKPIVTTNFPTASGIITHKKTGLICEMDANSITESILYYINNPDFKNIIIENLSKMDHNDKEKSLHAFNQLIE